jgi:tRNA dimethylallyltransferase
MTWFQRDPNIRWFHPDDEAAVMDYLQQNIPSL